MDPTLRDSRHPPSVGLDAVSCPDNRYAVLASTTGLNQPSEAGNGGLAAAVQPIVAAHPGQSGLHPFADAGDALAARLVLADSAQSSLDVQYFTWNKDMVGRFLVERLLRAADRGVRVRLLLDDVGTAPCDAELLIIDSHPNVEVRMFNPVALRTLRRIGIAANFARMNRRMHNKSFIADGQIAVVGGRNIGSEYFGAGAGSNFADLDLAVIGPVVEEVSSAFELYWTHQTAVPISALSPQVCTPAESAAKRHALVTHHTGAGQSAYADAVRDSEFVRQFLNGAMTCFWGQATIVRDHPDKVLTCSSKSDTHLAPKLREVVEKITDELFLVSPYFVPGKNGVALLSGARQRGLRVVVITNSLASTDSMLVHSGYQRYRRLLIEAGVELYEIKPTAGSQHRRSGRGWFGSKGAGASSGSSLHAKAFAFDRRIGFVGSYNLDPRSSKLNTEMGVLFDCPLLAQRLPEQTEVDLAHTAYRVQLDRRRLVWATHEGDNEVLYRTEPATSLLKRLKVKAMSWLPVEGLL